MSVVITTLGSKDNMNKSRIDINNNFSNIEDELALYEAKLDPSTGNLAVSNTTFEKGARSVATEIVLNEASQRIKGTLAVEGTASLNDVSLANTKSLTVNSGTISLLGDDAVLNANGRSNFGGYVVMKDYANTALDASNTGTYTSVTSNIGLLDISKKHAIILDFSSYSSSADVSNTNDVKDFKLPTGTYQGQILELAIIAGSSSGKPHSLKANNISGMSSSNSLQFQENGGHVTMRYIGSEWYITSNHRSNIA